MPLSQHALLTILENIPVAVMVADRTGRIVFANSNAIEVLGHTFEHLDGLGAYGTLHGRDSDGRPLEAHEYPIARALRGETVPITEYRYARPDGKEVWIRAAAAPIVDSSGQLGASVIFRNIDQEKAAAELLRAAELNRLQLEQALREQAEALRDADLRKDRFLAALSHELRNPLAAIASAAQVLGIQSDPPPMTERAIGVIERQLAQMTRLVDDLLEVARVSQGKLALHREPVEASTFVLAAADTVRARVQARQQSLDLALDPNPIIVEVDAPRMTQVVVNLLTNASKYTDNGGRIAVALRACGANAEIVVRDTGIGIPRDMQGQIFDLFAQVEQHRERSEGGLGLGLAIVERLTQLHGGTVSVHSDGPGHGSEFVVRLPLAATANIRS